MLLPLPPEAICTLLPTSSTRGRGAVATFDPTKAFGFSAFGPLKFRLVNKGVAGDWQPLVTLVRLPVLKDLFRVRGRGWFEGPRAEAT